ncbi:hypothetical protein ACA910_021276 [Epithemia clementina (nom. ined.)]
MAPGRSRSRTPPLPTSNHPNHGGNTTTNNTSTTADSTNVLLQDRLHELLTRLSTTVDRIKTWPDAASAGSSSDDAALHFEATSKLIQSIRHVLQSIDKVESIVKTNPTTLKARLNACPVPVDLLDLLDAHGEGGSSGLNPECFARGLLQEAIGQLEGLKRRKVALERLADAVQDGLEQKLLDQQQQRAKQQQQQATTTSPESPSARKRERQETNQGGGDSTDSEPPSAFKKAYSYNE